MNETMPNGLTTTEPMLEPSDGWRPSETSGMLQCRVSTAMNPLLGCVGTCEIRDSPQSVVQLLYLKVDGMMLVGHLGDTMIFIPLSETPTGMETYPFPPQPTTP